MIITVEEQSLLNSFEHSSRIAAALDIMAQLPNIQDEEPKEQCRTLAGKLTRMSDGEFQGIDFVMEYDN